MTQHLTTFPQKSSTSLSRLSTRRTNPKARSYTTFILFHNFELTRISEILQEITKETSRYIRHSLRSGATPLSTKDEQIPQKIDQSYAEVDKLAQEKMQLAERLGGLIQRARTRLDYDLRKVLILQGDDPGQPAFVSTSRNPIQEMNDSLRLAIAEASPIVPTPASVLATTQAPTQKSTLFLLFLLLFPRP
jgi:chromatin modification-related protein YNG2